MFEHLDAKVKSDWIEALRSGEYEQMRGALMKENYPNTPTYCCLGVLCDAVLEVGHYTDDDADEEMFDALDWFVSKDAAYEPNVNESYLCTSSIPTILRQHLGLSEYEVSTLIHLNDGVRCDDNPYGKHHSFAEIADVLENGSLPENGEKYHV